MSRLPSARAVVAVTVAAMCLGTAGCTTSGEADPEASASPSPSTSKAVSPKPVTLRFGVYGDETQVNAYEKLAEAFTEQHPDVVVAIEPAFDAEAGMEKLQSLLDEGKAPDVFVLEQEALPALVANEQVQPVDVLLEERGVDFGDGFQRDGLEAFSADASLQCMPHSVSPLVVYYNEARIDFEELTEPGEDIINAEDGWTWEQFALAAQQAARGKGKGVYIEPALETLAPFIWSGGGDLVDDNRSPTTLSLSEGDAREALETVLDVARDPQLTPTQAQLIRRDAVTRFERGQLGMILGTRALTPRLRDTGSLDFEVMPLPRLGAFRTIADMSGYCISADSRYIPAAADFLAFAVSEEGASITTKPGYLVPSNTQVAHSSVFTAPNFQPGNAFVFSEGVRRTEPKPYSAQWPEVQERVQPMLHRMFYAPVIDLEALLEEIDAASQEVFVAEEEQPDAG